MIIKFLFYISTFVLFFTQLGLFVIQESLRVSKLLILFL